MKCVRALSAIAVMILLISAMSGLALADPCLVVYPDGPCVYHYDPAEYYTVGPGDPLYDPLYDRGGAVLIEVGTNEIDYSIYQAPGLSGFEMSTEGNDGYFFIGNEFNLIIDGFSNIPITYVNIIVVFDRFDPMTCTPRIWVDGVQLTEMRFYADDLVVSTLTPDGNNYSDTESYHIYWEGCYGVHVWAFSDENGNGVHDGGECFTAFSHDLTIPVENTTWGAIKDLYR
jgi:hypothetical protein